MHEYEITNKRLTRNASIDLLGNMGKLAAYRLI